MEIVKNRDYIVKIEDLSTEGEGIGRICDGEGNRFPLFVKDTVIGDEARVRVIKVKKGYGYGRLMELVKPSPNRVEPPCRVARQCGGCTLQCMTYEEQLEFKRRKVENNLRRIGGLKDVAAEKTLGMKYPWRYRNKAQVPFGLVKGRVAAGFYAGHTHSIIDSEDCLIAPEINGTIIETIKKFMTEYQIPPYDETTGKGIVRHALIRVGFHTGQILVCLVINAGALPHARNLVERLQAIPGMTSVCLNINQKRTNVILGEEVVTLYGPGYLEDRIGDITFRISPQSFFQVNPAQTEVLYGKALEFAGLTGKETVWDLYCGIGTISLFLARSAKKVYGVEIVPAAIEDARGNAARNGLTNTEFFVGKAEEILPAWYAQSTGEDQRRADVIVVDPPRKGCDSALLDTIAAMSPDRVVYVSCDSATLARDLKYMTEKGYQVTKVQPVDMFPWTGHVETVVLLSKGEIDSKKVRVEFSLEDMDMSEFQDGATYPQIKAYVLEHSGLKVSNLYISQIKRKCGIEVGKNYNLPKSEDFRQPQCPPEKEKAIREAFKYFGMI